VDAVDAAVCPEVDDYHFAFLIPRGLSGFEFTPVGHIRKFGGQALEPSSSPMGRWNGCAFPIHFAQMRPQASETPAQASIAKTNSLSFMFDLQGNLKSRESSPKWRQTSIPRQVLMPAGCQLVYNLKLPSKVPNYELEGALGQGRWQMQARPYWIINQQPQFQHRKPMSGLRITMAGEMRGAPKNQSIFSSPSWFRA